MAWPNASHNVSKPHGQQDPNMVKLMAEGSHWCLAPSGGIPKFLYNSSDVQNETFATSPLIWSSVRSSEDSDIWVFVIIV